MGPGFFANSEALNASMLIHVGPAFSGAGVHMFLLCSRSFQNIWIDEPAESISLDQFTEELDPLMYAVLSRNEEGGTCSDGFYRWHGFVMVFNLKALDL